MHYQALEMKDDENTDGTGSAPPVGREKCEKHSLLERYEAIEGAVRGMGLPAGSENREILSLLDVKTDLRTSRQARRPHGAGGDDGFRGRIGRRSRPRAQEC